MPSLNMFAAADLFIINKVDVLPKMDRCIAHACSVKLGLREIVLSASSGQNLEEWYDRLRARRTLTSVARNP